MIRALVSAAFALSFASGVTGTASAQTLNMMKSIDAPHYDAQRTTCGQVLTPESLGVTHPVLPCGAKVVLRSGNKQVLTEVIDNKLVQPGRQLEVTEALATMLSIEGTVELEWRFATSGG